ncbi:hypothetical protein GQ53DRAFT_827258 [Thozetella sp. PMI_491]|nr:hypothetical protein GQ53DRAFT_827258 [Thozetella sp. PMI_491]
MGEPLKRTFHGCLTCRKRKVRCQGGNPCQNCVRMNITCHSSFENNLRVMVPTPSGQKTVGFGTQADQPKPAAAVRQPTRPLPTHSPTLQPPGPSTAVVPPASPAHPAVHSEPFVLDFSQSGSTFPLPADGLAFPPASTLAEFESLLSSESLTTDPFVSNRSWDFDFSLDPYVDYNFSPMNASETLPPTGQDGAFHDSRGARQVSLYNFCRSSDSDISATSDNEAPQTGTKEWSPRRRKKPKKTSEDPAGKQAEPSRSDSEEAKLYLKHYRDCTQSALTSKSEAKWSYHRFVIDFVSACTEQCPLRLAVLAWASRHHDPDSTAPSLSMEAWYSRAQEALVQLMALPDPTVELTKRKQVKSVADFIITTTLYLNRYDILGHDLESVDARLRQVTDWLSNHTTDLRLSAFSCKVLMWLCYLQVRISIFSVTTPHPSTLLDELLRRADYQIILERSHTYCSEVFGAVYPSDELAQDIEKIPVSVRLHETFCLLNAMLKYRSWRRVQGDGGTDRAEELASARQSAIDADIRRIDIEFGLAMLTNPTASILRHNDNHGHGGGSQPSATISRIGLNWLTVYAAFLTTKILWSRIVHPEIRTDDTSRAAVASILQIAMRLRRLKGARDHVRVLSSMLWPLPLFVASIETTDDVHADWMRLFMDQVGIQAGKEAGDACATKKTQGKTKGHTVDGSMKGGMSGGAGGDAVLQLMERIREKQDRQGARVDVEAVVQEMNRSRSVFIF